MSGTAPVMLMTTEDDYWKTLNEALRPKGFSIVYFGDLQSVLEYCQENPPEIICLDPPFWGQTERDLEEHTKRVIREIRSVGFEMVPIVILSNFEPLAVARLLEAGADDYIPRLATERMASIFQNLIKRKNLASKLT